MIALTGIYGIGRRDRAEDLCSHRCQPDMKIKELSEADLENIRNAIARYTVEGDLRRTVSMNIKRLMDLGCYRGIRHRRGLPVHGQQHRPTHAPARDRGVRSASNSFIESTS